MYGHCFACIRGSCGAEIHDIPNLTSVPAALPVTSCSGGDDVASSRRLTGTLSGMEKARFSATRSSTDIGVGRSSTEPTSCSPAAGDSPGASATATAAETGGELLGIEEEGEERCCIEEAGERTRTVVESCEPIASGHSSRLALGRNRGP